MSQMQVGRSSIRLMALTVTLALAACGSEAPVADPQGQSSSGSLANAEIPIMGPEKNILAFGDSLFAGYNVDPADSYPAKLQNALRARGINAQVGNAGVSGDTSAAGLLRFEFTLDGQDETPDLLILELGGNDLLRGIEPDQTRKNLAAMIQASKDRGIDVLLMGMRAPPNYGPEYQADFDSIYSDLAREYDASLIPFWVEPVADRPDLIQADRIHPTADGIELLVAETLDQVAAAIPEDEAS
ncbi:MAG: arylesterase [Erythrobacter sp.]